MQINRMDAAKFLLVVLPFLYMHTDKLVFLNVTISQLNMLNIDLRPRWRKTIDKLQWLLVTFPKRIENGTSSTWKLKYSTISPRNIKRTLRQPDSYCGDHRFLMGYAELNIFERIASSASCYSTTIHLISVMVEMTDFTCSGYYSEGWLLKVIFLKPLGETLGLIVLTTLYGIIDGSLIHFQNPSSWRRVYVGQWIHLKKSISIWLF